MAEGETTKFLNFHEMGLDDRILKAIAKMGWKEPTLIQEKAIPLALEGKDILARARTGSGKTAAFLIPLIQNILINKKNFGEQETRALILTPSKELCKQIHEHALLLTSSCSRDISCVDVSGQVDYAAQKPLLVEKPDIVIGTPTRILGHLQAHNIDLKSSLQYLVIDEADLVFSFGYENDIREVLRYLPQIYQAFLMSATMTSDVQTLKKIVLHNPAILKLEEPQLPQTSQLTQYHIKCEDEDKFVLIYALLKLKLICGKTLIFVNSVDRCYRLKLYLEQFGIRSCILNSELPVSSRCHIVTQFNAGLYDIIIASDEKSVENPSQKDSKPPKSKKFKKDKGYGVSRGIDFQFVSTVVNFDFPQSVTSYIHRVGRTARGNSEGTALSFVSVKEVPLLKEVERAMSSESEGNNGVSIFKPYQFKMEEIEGFRYRARDAYRAVTKIAIREARLKEIKNELLNSQKLKSYFEDNPRDLQLLRHDKALHTVKLQSHLKDVPDYIVPPILQNIVKVEKQKRFHNNVHRDGKQLNKQHRTRHLKSQKFKGKQQDPLKSFQFDGLDPSKKRGKRKRH